MINTYNRRKFRMSTSLNKISVPIGTATDQSQANQGLIMPKLKYRFRAVFENFGTNTADAVEMTRQVDSISRPTLNFNPFVIEVYNSKVNLAGKPSWNTVTVQLRDDVSNNVSKMVGQQVQKQFDFLEQASASTGSDYKFQLKFEMLDGGNGGTNTKPTVKETWELYGAFISEVSYGDMSYAESAPATITLTITYDNAIQSTGPAGIGTSVARLTARTIVTGVGT